MRKYLFHQIVDKDCHTNVKLYKWKLWCNPKKKDILLHVKDAEKVLGGTLDVEKKLKEYLIYDKGDNIDNGINQKRKMLLSNEKSERYVKLYYIKWLIEVLGMKHVYDVIEINQKKMDELITYECEIEEMKKGKKVKTTYNRIFLIAEKIFGFKFKTKDGKKKIKNCLKKIFEDYFGSKMLSTYYREKRGFKNLYVYTYYIIPDKKLYSGVIKKNIETYEISLFKN